MSVLSDECLPNFSHKLSYDSEKPVLTHKVPISLTTFMYQPFSWHLGIWYHKTTLKVLLPCLFFLQGKRTSTGKYVWIVKMAKINELNACRASLRRKKDILLLVPWLIKQTHLTVSIQHIALSWNCQHSYRINLPLLRDQSAT